MSKEKNEMKNYHRIRMQCLNISLYVYFDFDEFNKDYCKGKQIRKDIVSGYSSGNGIWIDLNYKNYKSMVVHEVSHYLDWTFDEVFICKSLLEATEIRAKLHEYLYREVIKIIDKEIKIM